MEATTCVFTHTTDCIFTEIERIKFIYYLDNAYTSNEQQQLGALQSLLGGYNSASERNQQQQQAQAGLWETGAKALGSLAAAPFTGGASLLGLTSLLGGGGGGQTDSMDPNFAQGGFNSFFGNTNTGGGTQFQLPKFF